MAPPVPSHDPSAATVNRNPKDGAVIEPVLATPDKARGAAHPRLVCSWARHLSCCLLKRAYIDELLPDVLEGRIESGRVFDRAGTLDEVPDRYRAMDDRDVLKFQITC
jgi:hypothetical protein